MWDDLVLRQEITEKFQELSDWEVREEALESAMALARAWSAARAKAYREALTPRQRQLYRKRWQRYSQKHRQEKLDAFFAGAGTSTIIFCLGSCGTCWCPRPLAGGRAHKYCSDSCRKRAARRDPRTRQAVLEQGRREAKARREHRRNRRKEQEHGS